MRRVLLLVIGAAFARALVPAEVVGNGLGNGLESGTAKSEVPSDGSQVEETPKTNNAKHRRNPFAKMFPEFEQLTPDEEYTGSALFLSPLIAAGKIKEAQQQSHAEFRLPSNRTVQSYSGFLTVSKKACNSNLFFWFFPAQQSPATAPVVLWLQGGPGGSSLFGLFVEHGPFSVDDNLNLVERTHTWTATHSVLYVDNPVGTGFSFTGKNECYATDQNMVANDLYDALQQFFLLFPQLQKNDFYATGESYAGKYVPAISYKIHTENQLKATKNKINFKGMAIGDGLCDPVSMTDYGDLLFNIGLIDERDRDYFKKVGKMVSDAINAKKYTAAFQLFDELLNGDLSGRPSYFYNVTGFKNYFNYALTQLPASFDLYPKYVQTPEVRRTIHVGDKTYHDGSTVEKHLVQDVMKSVKPWIEALISDGRYRVMIYNGQMDIIIGWPLTESFVTSMKWKGAKEYLEARRTQWHVAGELAGYAKQVGNLTVALVRNAGHMVPHDQPLWAFDLINRFTSGKKFN